MKPQQIIENNKLIAEFMGVTPVKTQYTANWYDGNELHKAGLPFSCGQMGNGTDEPKFYTSWDWLMPVVDKIYSFDEYYIYKADLGQFAQSIGEVLAGAGKPQKTYESVVEFITWYNEQK